MKKLLLFLWFLCSLALLSIVPVWGQTILVPIGSGPIATELIPDANMAIVVNRNSNSVSIVKLADNTISKTIQVGTSPTSVAVNPTTNRAVVTNFGSDNVSIIDLSNDTVLATVDVGKKDPANPNFRYSPRDVAIDTSRNIAIIANINGNSITLIDLNTNATVLPAPIQVGANPISVAYDPGKNVALVANFQSNTVTIVDMQSHGRIRDISVGIKPVDIALNLKTRRALVVNQDTNDLTVLNLDDVTSTTANPVTATVAAVGTKPFSVGVNPNTNIAAVVSNGNRNISLINLADNTKFTTVISSIGDNPTHLTVNPVNNTALVSSPTNDSVYIVPLGFLNYLPFALDTEKYRSNLAINNLSSAEANVQIELHDSAGVLLASASAKVPAQGLKQINNINRFLIGSSSVSNTTGMIKLMSDRPLSSFISVIDNSSNDPGLQVGRSSGFSKLLLNSATNAGAFRSRLVILNTGNASAAVTLTARNSEDGETIGTKSGIFIVLNGFFISDNIFSDLGISGKFGPLQIESPNFQSLIAVTLVESDSHTSGFLEAIPIQ